MPKRKPKRPSRQLPSRAEIIDYIAKSPTPLARRDLVRAFKVEPKDRLALKALIREIEREGPVERTGKRRFKAESAKAEADAKPEPAPKPAKSRKRPAKGKANGSSEAAPPRSKRAAAG